MLLLAMLVTPAVFVTYTSQSYESFWARLLELQRSQFYGKLFKVYEGFSTYHIHPVPKCGESACKNPIIEITDFEQSSVVNTLPTVLLVAGFHGDEVLGTYVLYYLIDFIEKNYLKKPFLINMLKNVRLILVPMANVNGFYNSKREETVMVNGAAKEMDPNRDFPFNQNAGGHCFETSTALLLDAIFRENVVIGTLTFHGGMNSITYPWGNYAHQNEPKTNDHLAFSSVAKLLQQSAGQNRQMNVQTYDIGTMHHIVYDVNGGFEDWAYGASFDTPNVSKNCAVKTNVHHGITNNIKYPDQTNRAFVYLIEAGLSKRPKDAQLGNDIGLVSESLKRGTWGHLTRNIEVCLNFAKVVSPFVIIKRLSFQEKLQISLKVFGCLKIDSLSVNGHQSKVLSQKYIPLLAKYNVQLEVNIPKGVHEELEIELSCDQNWADSQSGVPQSHLVRLRTQENYSIKYKNFAIHSNKVMRIKILNVRTGLLDHAIVQSARKGVFSLSYQIQFEAISANKKTHKFIRYKNDSIQTVSQQGDGFVKSQVSSLMISTTALKVKPSTKNRQRAQRKLIFSQNNKNLEISSEGLIELIGTPIFIQTKEKWPDTKNDVYLPDVVNSKEEDQNALFISDEGVGCGVSDDQRTKSNQSLFLSLRPDFRNDKLTVNLFVPDSSISHFKVAKYNEQLTLIKTIESEKKSISHYQTQLSNLTLNDYRLLGRQIVIYDKAGSRVIACKLRTLVPDEDSARIFGFKKRDEFVRSRFSLSIFVVLLVLGVFMALIFFWIRKGRPQIVTAIDHQLKPSIIID